jgi:hypothetical protein
MSLANRLQKLETEIDAEDLGRPFEQRLREALQQTRERRMLGLPRPSPPWKGTDHPLAARLQAAHARADALRQQLAG